MVPASFVLIGVVGLCTIAVRFIYQYFRAEAPDKLVVDLSTVEAGQIVNLPAGTKLTQVEFVNPLDEQDYVLKKYVAASSAAEAIGLDAQTPVAEVFIREGQVQFAGQTDAVGFHAVHPEEE